MFFSAVASTGEASPPIWFPTGFRFSTSNYQEVLQKTLIYERSCREAQQGLYIQQNGAPAHTARLTQAYLREACVDFWQKNMWLPSSPDLSPLDFSIWGYIESMACSKRYSSLNALKKSVNRAWRNMNKAFVIKVCSKFRPRLEACVEAKGGLIK